MTGLALQLVEESRPRCHVCGSFRVGTAGGPHLRASRNDLVQRYKCRACGASFSAGIWDGHRFERGLIMRAVQMVREGYSMRAVAEAVTSWAGRRVTPSGVATWVRKFAPGVSTWYPAPVADEELVKAVRSPVPEGRLSLLPAVHLDDLDRTRRVVLADPVRRMAKHPVVPASSPLYRALHSTSPGRTKTVSVKLCRRLAGLLDVSMEELELHVTTVYSGKSGRSRPVKARFPIRATGGHAFLMGLFYASGGIGEREMHVAVDRAVGAYLREELSKDLGEVPSFRAQGSASRPAHGSFKVVYSQATLEVLRKFGLKTAPPVQLGRGKYVPSRYITQGVPAWVRREPRMLHRFVEGYVNGLKTSAGLAGRIDRRNGGVGHPQTYVNVKVSFCGYDVKELQAFVGVFVRHFRSLGVYPGWVSRLRRDGRKMQHLSYGFHSAGPLKAFRENFLVLRPMVRAKLGLRLTEDAVLAHVVQRVRGMDGYVLGMLVEGPKTLPQLVDDCPRRPYNMTTEELLLPSLEKLARMGAIVGRGGTWRYDPARFATSLADAYGSRAEAKERRRREMVSRGVRLPQGALNTSRERLLERRLRESMAMEVRRP